MVCLLTAETNPAGMHSQNLIGIQANINLTIDALRSELGCQIFNRVDNILLDAIGYR